MYIRGAHVARTSLMRWDSSSPKTPFLLASRVMPGCTLKVWRTDGYGGPIPPSDYQLLTQTAFAFGQVHRRERAAPSWSPKATGGSGK